MQSFSRVKKAKFAIPDGDNIEKEGLVPQEANAHHDLEYYQLQRSHQVLKRWIIGLAFLLAAALATLLFLLIKPTSTRTSPVPNFPSLPIKFEQDERFAPLISQESDEAWSSMMPTGDGFIVIDDPRSFSLPPGQESSRGELYDISLFHQLHCLSKIRSFVSTMKQAIGRNDTQEINEIILDPMQNHMAHCFDYLRQSLMCHGDMTLEWPRTEPDGRRFVVDGWHIEHQCKNWDSIMEYMKEKAG